MYYISLVPTFFAWWYGRGLKDLFRFLAGLFSYLTNMFSFVTLLKTLFQPWKKMVGEKGRGVEGLKIWLLDNFVSRTVGFFVRLVMLLIFTLAFLLYFLFSIVAIVFWIAMPSIVIGSFIYIFLP